MSASQVILSIIEILAVCLAVIGLFNENRIAQFERKLAKRFLRWILKKYDARQEAKKASRKAEISEAQRKNSVRVYTRANTYIDSADYVA